MKVITDRVYEQLFNLSGKKLTPAIYLVDNPTLLESDNKKNYFIMLDQMLSNLKLNENSTFLQQYPLCKEKLEKYIAVIKQEAEKDADCAYLYAQLVKDGISGLVEKNDTEYCSYLMQAANKKHAKALKEFGKEPLHSKNFLESLKFAEQNVSFCTLVLHCIEKNCKKYYSGIGGTNAAAICAFVSKNYKGSNALVKVIGDKVYEQLFTLSGEQLTPEMYSLPLGKQNKKNYLTAVDQMLSKLKLSNNSTFLQQYPLCKEKLKKYIAAIKQETEKDADYAYSYARLMKEGISGLMEKNDTEYCKYLVQASCKEHSKALKELVECAEKYNEKAQENIELLKKVYNALGKNPKQHLQVYWARLNWIILQYAEEKDKLQKLEPFAQQLVKIGNKALHKTIGEVYAELGNCYASQISTVEREKKGKIIQKTIKMLEAGTQYNNIECYFGLGCIIMNFYKQKEHYDYDKAYAYIQHAADAGHKEAQEALAGLTLYGPSPLYALSVLLIPMYAKGYAMLAKANPNHEQLLCLSKPDVSTEEELEELIKLGTCDNFYIGTCAFDLGKLDIADTYFKQCNEVTYPQLCFYKGYCKLIQERTKGKEGNYAEVCALLAQALALDNNVYGAKADFYKKYAMSTLLHESLLDYPEATIAAMKFLMNDEAYLKVYEWRVVLSELLNRFSVYLERPITAQKAANTILELYSSLHNLVNQYKEKSMCIALEQIYALAYKVNAQNMGYEKQKKMELIQEKFMAIPEEPDSHSSSHQIGISENENLKKILGHKEVILAMIKSCKEDDSFNKIRTLQIAASLLHTLKQLVNKAQLPNREIIEQSCNEINESIQRKGWGYFVYNDKEGTVSFFDTK